MRIPHQRLLSYPQYSFIVVDNSNRHYYLFLSLELTFFRLMFYLWISCISGLLSCVHMWITWCFLWIHFRRLKLSTFCPYIFTVLPNFFHPFILSFLSKIISLINSYFTFPHNSQALLLLLLNIYTFSFLISCGLFNCLKMKTIVL